MTSLISPNTFNTLSNTSLLLEHESISANVVTSSAFTKSASSKLSIIVFKIVQHSLLPPCGAQRVPNPEQSIKKFLMSLLIACVFPPLAFHSDWHLTSFNNNENSGLWRQNITRSAHTEPRYWSYRSSLTVGSVRRENYAELHNTHFCVSLVLYWVVLVETFWENIYAFKGWMSWMPLKEGPQFAHRTRSKIPVDLHESCIRH